MADRRLQIFRAVARQRSFTQAARDLFMSQSSVTFQIKQLEDELNTQLFVRTFGNITLTPAGKLVLDYAERILDLSGEMESRLGEMTGEVRGNLRIGASAAVAEFMLPPILGGLNAHYPQVRPCLAVANSGSVQKMLIANEVDVGLIEGTLGSDDLVGEICGESGMVAIFAPDYPLADKKEVGAKTLRDYEYISREEGSGTRTLAEGFFRQAGVLPESLKVQMELGSPELLKTVVAGGHGFSIVPAGSCQREVQAGLLCAVPLKPRLSCTILLVYPKGRYRTRLTSTFIAFAKQLLRESAS